MKTIPSEKKPKPCEIAVIGIGCNYPGAKSPKQFWENILARKQQFREMPDIRLPLTDYYDPDPTVADKTYQKKAAVLDGYKFNWLDRKIPKSTYESTDIVHWLALATALEAFDHAGLHGDATTFRSQFARAIDYTFFYGPELDDVIRGYRLATGDAPLWPEWASARSTGAIARQGRPGGAALG